MYQRLNEVPVLDSYPSRIPGPVWNAWRRYQARQNQAACFGLEGLAPMSVYLDKDAWVVMDSSLYDLPVLAWTAFDEPDDRELHQPVCCQIRQYHQGGAKLREQALNLIKKELEARMKLQRGGK